MSIEAIFYPSHQTKNLKKAIAQILFHNHIDQSKISTILGVSQSMISNYCTSNDHIPSEISTMAHTISDYIINGESVQFQTCVSLTTSPCLGFQIIADKNEILNDEKYEIMNNLSLAFDILKDQSIHRLTPKIKINIAMGKKHATTSDDIASFLNGLIIVEGKIIGYNGIRFGTSKHLSSLILTYGSTLQFTAIMNIAYNKHIPKTGFSIGYLEKDYKLRPLKKTPDILIHKGDFGIEPCTYVLGKDAVEVAEKTIEIKEKIQ